MACCTLTNGVTKSCGRNTGGIKRIFIGCQSNVTGTGVTFNGGNPPTGVSAFATGACWRELEFFKETSNLSVEAVFPTGGQFVGMLNTTVEVVLDQINMQKYISLYGIGTSELSMIVLDNNNNYWVYGISNPVYMTGYSGETGTAFLDSNNITVTFTVSEKAFPPQLDPVAAPTLITMCS